ncbi:MAG: carbohydrate porin [Phycisphaerae bacterium]|nr:carbohydrate porin [Tepidisphaeraceae bacterium]
MGPQQFVRSALFVLPVIGLFAAAPARAAEPPEPVSVEDALTLAPGLVVTRVEVSPQSVDANLVDAAARPAGLLPWGPVSLLDPMVKQFNKSAEKVGLNVGFAYTMIYQAASNGPGERDGATGDVDIFGNWRLLGAKDDPGRGLLYFAFENRHQMFTSIPAGSLGGEIGSLWGTTNGFGERPLCVKELYWQQHFGGDQVILRVGKMDAENLYGSNYWQSDAKYFVNKAFSGPPTNGFPGAGLGFNVQAKVGDQWSLSAGAQDAQGSPTQDGFDTFFGDFNLFYAAELRYSPVVPGWGKGTYRATAWYRDAGEADGKDHDAGFSISCDQRIGKHWVPFFRYGVAQGHVNGVEQMLSLGVGWEGKVLTPSDVVGVAGSWGQPTDHDLRDQYAFEAFYRMQVSPDNQLTVGYQLILNPSNAPDDDCVGVFEIRWRISI